MIHMNNFSGQLCFLCEQPINGEGLLAKAPEEGTTIKDYLIR